MVINVDVDPSLIDINIHPTKMDIKFSKIESLKELAHDAITKQLTKLTLIPEVKKEEFITQEEEREILTSYLQEKELEVQSTPISFEKPSFDFSYEVQEEALHYQDSPKVSSHPKEPRIKKMFPVGLVHGTYIIAENEEGMFVIDQHAANERINYETYLYELGTHEKQVMDLLFPITMELPMNEYIILKEHLDIFASLGIIYEEFGLNTLVIRSVPMWLPKNSTEEALRKIVDVIVHTEHFDSYKFSEKIAITLACKMSIKANDHIELADMEVLLERLRSCENPFTCPHGRPTIITYSNYELEKLFKRAAD